MAKKNKFHDHPELLGTPEVRRLYHTQGLFSDHYVKARLAKNDWWPSADQARPVWEFCRDLYNKRYLALAKNNEAFTRQELIDRVLEKLGFAWTDNLGLPNEDTEPDYVLFTSQAEKESVLEKDTASRYRAAAAILEAKKLNHPLSQVSKHQLRYPHQQIRDYLQDAQVLEWGILTNGNEWRLYGRSARRQDFFAINFEVAIQSLENFKLFLALLSPAALQRDAQGKCRLDFIRDQSLSAQSQLEADLRQRVYTILTDLASGFASRPENQIPDTEDARKALYGNCLIYLYRLLFLLYAEGRGLLPVEPRTRRYYKELSLERLKPDLKNFAAYDSHTRTRLGEDICELFRLVNGTDQAKNKEYSVARYNGGLFEPTQHPLLEDWRIADADLASVLRGLMFDPPPKPNEPSRPVQTVDFGDLRVQQLGSIYEGLLEHHFIRDADGRLQLQTDRAERKATGTYYTPDYIVKYIVEQTLTPLLDEIERGEPVRAARDAKRQDNSFAEAVLALNICDPAMGSGHFLVEATTVLADHIAAHPTTRRLHEKSKDEEELAYWRRRVVEACIYGVDLNPLAVELAKLSFWLTCIASDQPLNFLDHHLRCGNSLIGARLDQLGSLPEKKAKRGAAAKQIAFTFGPDFKRAVADTIGAIKAIEQEASGDVEKVKEKERRWAAEILPRLASYKKVANLWTNTFFDGPLSEEEYLAAARAILVAAEAAADSLRETSEHRYLRELDKPYFHWELEFPDVFFAADGAPKTHPGFDAVIGNPPWLGLRTGDIPQETLPYLRQNYSTAAGQFDLASLFLELACRLVATARGMGQVIPKRILTNENYQGLRKSLAVERRLSAAVDLGVAFEGVDADAAIIVSEAKTTKGASSVLGKRFGRNELRFAPIPAEAFGVLPFYIIPINSNAASVRLAVKIGSGNVTQMGDSAEITRGAECGMNHPAFSRTKSPKALPAIDHLDMDRHFVAHNGWFVNPGAIESSVLKSPKLYLTTPKLLIRFLATGLVAAVDDVGFVTTNLVYHAHCSDPHFLCALVSSRLLNFWYRTAFQNDEIKFPHVQKSHLVRIPIRRIAFTTPAAKRAALLAKAQTFYERAMPDGDSAGILAFVDEQLRAQPERADVVHDLLAFLAEQMLDLNRRQHAAARQFLADLKDFHGIDARALNPKTKLDKFWKLDTAEVFAHLSRNRKALAAAKLELDEAAENKIRSRFEQSRAAILPLESQIASTDRLIDEIVYRLYGLTPEEKALVESGAAKAPAADASNGSTTQARQRRLGKN
ncbi:MAG: TaqI-like C-terminal specificity domain-containing protein [Verrucomicrobiota bacterium]